MTQFFLFNLFRQMRNIQYNTYNNITMCGMWMENTYIEKTILYNNYNIRMEIQYNTIDVGIWSSFVAQIPLQFLLLWDRCGKHSLLLSIIPSIRRRSLLVLMRLAHLLLLLVPALLVVLLARFPWWPHSSAGFRWSVVRLAGWDPRRAGRACYSAGISAAAGHEHVCKKCVCISQIHYFWGKMWTYWQKWV